VHILLSKTNKTLLLIEIKYVVKNLNFQCKLEMLPLQLIYKYKNNKKKTIQY